MKTTIKKILPSDELIIVEYGFDTDFAKKNNQDPYFAATYSMADSGGSDSELIAKEFPEIAHLVKYHLVSTKEPMHYVVNSMYWAEQGNLEYARSTAIWPNAELSDFTKEKLLARLPELMAQFKADIVKAGIQWPSETLKEATK